MYQRLPVDLEAFDFEVADGGLEFGVPIDQAAVAVDEALLVEGDEDFADGGVEAFVHSEAFAGPIERGAEGAKLVGDGAAGFGFPLPDALEEAVAAHLLAGFVAFGGEEAFDDHLGGDAGVVGAGLPEGVAALHAAPADEDVLQRHGQGVAHVEAAGDVGRRDHDGVGRRGGGRVGAECVGLFPPGVEGGFDRRVIEAFAEHWGGHRGGSSRGRRARKPRFCRAPGRL